MTHVDFIPQQIIALSKFNTLFFNYFFSHPIIANIKIITSGTNSKKNINGCTISRNTGTPKNAAKPNAHASLFFLPLLLILAPPILYYTTFCG